MRVDSSGEIYDLAFMFVKALDQRLGSFNHRGREGQYGLAREQRRQRTALKLPLIAFHRQQSVRQSCGKNTPLQPILLIVFGIGHKHAPDGGRLIDYRNAPDRQPRCHDRFLEMGCRPRFERVAREDAKQRNRTQGVLSRDRCRRAKLRGKIEQ